MLTGHDITTGIVNHNLADIMTYFEFSDNHEKILETIQTGGLFTIKHIQERYPMWLLYLLEWRDYINSSYMNKPCCRKEICEIFTKLCNRLYWPVLREEIFGVGEHRNYLINHFDDIISKIEEKTRNEGTFNEIFNNSAIYHTLTIRIKPLFRSKGIPNIPIEIEQPLIKDSYGLKHIIRGMTNNKGEFSTQILEGNILIRIKTKNKDLINDLKLVEDEIKTISPTKFKTTGI